MPQLPRLLLFALLATGCASTPQILTTEFVVTGMTRTKAGHL